MKKVLFISILLFGQSSDFNLYAAPRGAATSNYSEDSDPKGYVDSSKWEMVWSDEFDYENSNLEKKWISDDGRYKSQILCTRHRENAVVEDGTLKLINKRESRNPKTEWTSGNVWTKETFQYGYFECRYKYAAAYTTNNAFWIMPAPGTPIPKGGIKYEIDINEGRYPNELYLDLHDWTNFKMVDGQKVFPRDSKCYVYGAEPEVSIVLNTPLKSSKIRFSTKHKRAFRMGEFRILAPNSKREYPSIMKEGDITGNYLKDRGVQFEVCGKGDAKSVLALKKAFDGNPDTPWLAPLDGDKYFTVDLGMEKYIGAVQFVTGSPSSKTGAWTGMLTDYLIEAWDGKRWVKVHEWDVRQVANFAEQYHTYGLEWTKRELIYYFDGVPIRREPNKLCHNPGNVYLSLAILKYLGQVPDDVDGSSMEVDYVRIYKERK
ncbi:MAG: family 16 glycosylhydrolase [Rikenellaceae bacterium]